MHVFCAWCRRDGSLGYLGMREPLENPELTHGVCRIHKGRLLESIPARSFPGVELLLVVRRNGTLYTTLACAFAGVPSVKVILERRLADRRSSTRPVTNERRHVRTGRRIRQGTGSPLGGFMVVRFTPKEIIPPLPPSAVLPSGALTQCASGGRGFESHTAHQSPAHFETTRTPSSGLSSIGRGKSAVWRDSIVLDHDVVAPSPATFEKRSETK